MEEPELVMRPTSPFGQTRWLSFRMHAVDWLSILTGAFSIGLLISVLLTVDLPPEDYRYIPLVILLVFFSFFLVVYPECLYRITYDDDAIYMRPTWFTWKLRPKPFVRLPFDHIGLVTGERAPINQQFYGSNRFTPFQYASVYPSIWPEDWKADEVFLLIGARIKDQEFRDLLWLINEKAPGTLDENVIAFLESDRKF